MNAREVPVTMTVVTKPLGEQISVVVLARIIQGRYQPGERLAPDELRAEFGVSLSPVRDAIHRLSHLGYLEVRARSGVHVVPIDAKRAGEIFDVRIALESLAVERLTTSVPEAELAELVQSFRRARQLLDSSGDDALAAQSDELLDDLMLGQTDNKLLRDMLGNIKGHVAWVRAIAGDVLRRYPLSFAEHEIILAAIAARDPAAAARATREHLENTRQYVIDYLEAHRPVR
ncbi:MAG: GntR family transcriptional regulator [Chloroflexota bacterium]